MQNEFIFQKPINKSMLTRGFVIDTASQKIFATNLSGGELSHGEKRHIKILFDNDIFEVVVRNIGFDRKKYPIHKDLLSVEYNKNSSIAVKLREIVKNQSGELILYATTMKDIFELELILEDELPKSIEANEMMLENYLETDESADIIEQLHLQKIRRLNISICDHLKTLYEYRCQICGQKIGMNYDTKLVECHHIKYFSQSLNNNSNNLLIVCPNHHRVIHATNPIFDYENKSYKYPNGLVEGLKLNKHL